MTPRNGQSNFAASLAFKSREIEELTDVYFFRPIGALLAHAARSAGISPSGLTVVGTLIGVAAGALLYYDDRGLLAFGLLIVHSVVDSADGQLARITGRVTDFGRVLDGLSGYATHVAIYLGIALGMIHRGAGLSILVWMVLAGMATALHAGMYDYHRNAYTAVVVDGRVPKYSHDSMPTAFSGLFALYLLAQRWLVGSHTKVEKILTARAIDFRIGDQDRQHYRRDFYALVRGWNFLGDNTRFFAIGLLVCYHRIDLFFLFVLGPMNLAFLVLWFWQRGADQRFLASL